MSKIFSVQEREEAFNYILSITKECSHIVSLVQVGSGAIGYHDERSDLDFVIALDEGSSMSETMEYMYRRLSEKYEFLYSDRNEAYHLQNFVLTNMLEIDLGYGWYEHAAARKPAFKVLYDNTGVVEEKMVKSREWMDNSIFGEKEKKDVATACDSAWARLMHASVAIYRGNYLRAIGEMENVRRQYIELLGDRYRLESANNRELDCLPENEKAALKSTFVTDDTPEALWTSLINLTECLYRELEGKEVPITREMIYEYYKNIRVK